MIFCKGGKMQQHWHRINISCVDCEVECTHVGALCSADGEIMFLAECPKCKTKIKWLTTGPKLAYIALRNDMEMSRKENAAARVLKPRTPVQPPLQLPRVDEKLNNDDAKWMTEMHIQPPEEGLLQ